MSEIVNGSSLIALLLHSHEAEIHADDDIKACVKDFVDLPRVGRARTMHIDILRCVFVEACKALRYVFGAWTVLMRACVRKIFFRGVNAAHACIRSEAGGERHTRQLFGE